MIENKCHRDRGSAAHTPGEVESSPQHPAFRRLTLNYQPSITHHLTGRVTPCNGCSNGSNAQIPRVYRGANGLTGKMTPGSVSLRNRPYWSYWSCTSSRNEIARICTNLHPIAPICTDLGTHNPGALAFQGLSTFEHPQPPRVYSRLIKVAQGCSRQKNYPFRNSGLFKVASNQKN